MTEKKLNGVDVSTVEPFDDAILVKMTEIEEKTKSGVIIHTEKTSIKALLGNTRAIIEKIGPNAFNDYKDDYIEHHNFQKTTPDKIRVPQVGDKVLIERHTGLILEGGNYRLIKARDMRAVIGENK